MCRIILSIVSIATLLCHARAEAVTFVVSPGTGTLQTAIDNAAPGDTLKLQNGFYTGAVIVDKSLRILGPHFVKGDLANAVIDAGCAATTALEVAADDVRLQRLIVQGGTLSTIDINGRTGVQLKQVVPLEGAFGCGAVEYGINVVNSRDVRIVDCDVIGDNGNGYTGLYGYHDAGIYIGGIPSDGRVSIKNGYVVGNNRGIVIEDSAPVLGSIRVQKMGLPSNDTGILVHNSDGVVIAQNVVNDARGSTPAVGIELDGTSDNNLVKKNFCSGAVTDVIDNGTGNCWLGNTYDTGTVSCD
jgi:nitrous oxidase accessory protein NosD